LKKIKEKESLWGNCLWSSYPFHSCIFPKCFLCDLFSKHFVFSHFSYHLYLIYRILFLWENWFVIYWDHQVL